MQNRRPNSLSPLSVQDAIRQVSKKRDDFFDKKKARYTLADGVYVFRQSWTSASKTHFPGYPVPEVSPTRHVPRIKSRLIEPLRTAEYRVDAFVDYVIGQWSVIRLQGQFKRFKFYPDVPNVDWVLKYSDIYIQVFLRTEGVLPSSAPAPAEVSEDKGSNSKLIATTQKVIAERDREIARLRADYAKLRAENSHLQNTGKSAKPKRSAKPSTTNNPPEWD